MLAELSLAELNTAAGDLATTLVLGTARMIGIASIFPAFTFAQIPVSARFGVALAFSAPAIPGLFDALRAEPIGLITLAAYTTREIVLGLALGWLAALPIWAASAAGDLIDLVRGSDAQGLFNPTSGEEGSVTGGLFQITALVVFAVMGGFSEVIRLAYTSFGLWPVLSAWPNVSLAGTDMFVEAFSTLIRIGLLIASPIVMAIMLGEIALLFMARSARRFPAMDLDLAFKNLVFCFVLPIGLVSLAETLAYFMRTLGAIAPRLGELAR